MPSKSGVVLVFFPEFCDLSDNQLTCNDIFAEDDWAKMVFIGTKSRSSMETTSLIVGDLCGITKKRVILACSKQSNFKPTAKVTIYC